MSNVGYVNMFNQAMQQNTGNVETSRNRVEKRCACVMLGDSITKEELVETFFFNQ